MVVRYSARLLDQKVVKEGLKILTFAAPNDLKPKPGQYMIAILKLPNGESIRRQYSIASKESEVGKLVFAITEIKEGLGSPILCNLQTGQEIEFQGPLGSFFLTDRDLGKDLTFVSAGTGIAPFRAMIDFALNHDKKSKIRLVAGYRYEENRLFHEEFLQMEKDYTNFEYHYTISRPKDPNYNGNKGHVQEVLTRIIDNNFSGEVYICGLKKMIEEVGALLSAKGVYGKRVHFETYD